MIVRTLSAALLIFAALPAIAAEERAPTFEECGSKSGQSEMNACFAKILQNLDADLIRDYAKLMDRLKDAAAKTMLRDAERAWLVYRDKHCAFVSFAAEGGTIRPSINAVCVADLTKSRTRELDDQLDCKEGDLACVATRNP